MTSLRFVGDLPMWLGLLLAMIVAVLSWRYYRRESFDLPHRLRWFLPLLRSLAFFLGVMVLTGPVLHHRTIIGELGRVQVYLDTSNSMTMQDRHMSPGRKLLVAEQLGWLSPGKVDATLLKLADELSDARREFVKQTSSDNNTNVGRALLPVEEVEGTGKSARPTGNPTAANVQKAAQAFLDRLKSMQSRLPQSVAEQFTTELLPPLETFAASNLAESDATVSPPIALAKVCELIEASIHEAFHEAVAEIIESGDESIRSALTLFDETPRWRRTELGLTDSAADILASLREVHDVDVLMLNGDQAVVQNIASTDSDSPAQNAILPIAEARSNSTEVAFANLTDLSTGIVSSQKGISKTNDAESSTTPPQTAVVLFTDGQHNAGPSPLQTARVLGGQGVAFYCISVGATQQAADLAVIGLEHPQVVFQKDRVRGAMIIRDQMPAGKSFVAQISHADEVLWQEQLMTQNSVERHVEFEFAIDELVERMGAQFASDVEQHALPLAFQASIVPLPEESETSNNQRTIRLAAITESYKVLLIDGRSRWETRYLRNVYERDEQWRVNTVIAGPGTDNATLLRGDQDGQFPADRDALFEYDMIIFGEVSPELLTEAEFTWIREFVEIRGGGMVFIDGQRGRLRELTEQNLATLLPVDWLPEVIASKPTALQLSDKGATESALRLAVDDQQNRRFWLELPAPHTLSVVEALPGAEVLVEVDAAGRQLPAMVTRPFGAGRVLYMAFDETWRWRYKVADTWHQRVWNQLARYVMPRPFAVSDEYASLDSGPVSYDFGDSVDIRVRLMGLDGKPSSNATADALVWKDGRIISTISLDPDTDVPGIYRGLSPALPEGEYEVSLRASGYSESVLKARTQFVVLPPESGEMSQTAANEDLLKQMATASGGAFLREEEMGKLAALLSPLSNGRVVESDTLIWQSYWWFAAIVTLMTLEWMLRKRAGLL